jgi:signal peptidase I
VTLVGGRLSAPLRHRPARSHSRSAAVLRLVLVIVPTVAVLGLIALGRQAHWRVDWVRSESMTPAVPKGALALVAPVERTPRQGEVVVFRDRIDRRLRVLHRIVDVIPQGEGVFYETKGDGNATSDPYRVPIGDVEGRLVWSAPLLGWLLGAAATRLGRLAFLVLPLVVFTSDQLHRRHSRKALSAGTRSSRIASLSTAGA